MIPQTQYLKKEATRIYLETSMKSAQHRKIHELIDKAFVLGRESV